MRQPPRTYTISAVGTCRFSLEEPSHDSTADIVLALAVTLLFLVVPGFAQEQHDIHFINVGQGDCTLIECPNGTKILVDCGSTSGGNPLRVRSYLLSELDADEPQIDVLVITHPDADHYNMLPQVLEGIAVGLVMTVGGPKEHDRNDVDEWLEDQENVVIVGTAEYDPADEPSDRFIAGDVAIHIMAANTMGDPSPTNTRSIVLGITYEDFDCMLTGDATFATEDRILERYEADWLQFEVLKIGHHGSSTTSTSQTWADAIQRQVAIASCSFSNSYGHPRQSVFARLEPHTIAAEAHPVRWALSQRQFENVDNYEEAIYSTATNGDIVVETDGETYSVVYTRTVSERFRNRPNDD